MTLTLTPDPKPKKHKGYRVCKWCLTQYKRTLVKCPRCKQKP